MFQNIDVPYVLGGPVLQNIVFHLVLGGLVSQNIDFHLVLVGLFFVDHVLLLVSLFQTY